MICLLVCGRRIFIVLSYFSKSKWNNYRGYEYAYATSTVENEYSNVRRQTQRLRQHSQYGGMLSRRKCLSLSFTLNAIRVLMFSAQNFNKTGTWTRGNCKMIQTMLSYLHHWPVHEQKNSFRYCLSYSVSGLNTHHQLNYLWHTGYSGRLTGGYGWWRWKVPDESPWQGGTWGERGGGGEDGTHLTHPQVPRGRRSQPIRDAKCCYF